ncbi:hypothetical protein TNCV_2307791 [Trichonephila clavipes]|nr:hypothetical protein TNCV_2307791 [Trichonephila clavipes]
MCRRRWHHIPSHQFLEWFAAVQVRQDRDPKPPHITSQVPCNGTTDTEAHIEGTVCVMMAANETVGAMRACRVM